MQQLTKGEFASPAAPLSLSDEPINLAEAFAKFLRRLPVFLAIVAVILAVVLAVTFTAKPNYTATATVVIRPPRAEVVASEPQGAPQQNVDSVGVDTEVGVMRSPIIAARVVDRLKLAQDPEFNGVLRPQKAGLWARLLGRASKIATPPPGASAQQADVVDAVLRHIKTRRSGLTYAIDLSFTALEGEKAAAIANAFADEYLNYNVEAKTSSAQTVGNFVNARLESLAKELETNEAAVEQYKVAHNLVIAQGGATTAEQDLSALNGQIVLAKADLAEKQARLNSAHDRISRGGGGGDVGAALGSPVIQKLREQRSDMLHQQAELLTRYGPQHPSIKQVDQQIAENQKQIEEEIGRILSNLEAEVQIAQERVNSLVGSRGLAQGSVGSNTQAVVGLNELQRKADASRSVYEAFLNRSKTSTAQDGLQSPDARVTAYAQPPKSPSSPKKPLNLALGLVVAIGAGFAGVLIAENLDRKLVTSKDVELKLGLPCIGEIPLLTGPARSSGLDYVVAKPLSSFAEALRGLRASLMPLHADRAIQVVAITSALPGEGKTFTAATLGRLCAQSGSKTLVIDCDLRRHQLTDAFHTPPPSGLLEVLTGAAPWRDALLRDDATGMDLLLLSTAPVPTEDFFGGAAFKALLKDLRGHYDFVFIDTPPVLAIAESRMIASEADATIFLIHWLKTHLGDCQNALDLLAEAGARLAGVCLTQINMSKQARIGYGDRLYNYRRYREYYTH